MHRARQLSNRLLPSHSWGLDGTVSRVAGLAMTRGSSRRTRRVVLSRSVAAVIVLIPIAVYLVRSGTNGRSLRAVVGECSQLQRTQHRAACTYIDAHPTIDLVGPIDETGTPFANALHRAGDRRGVELRLDSGRYSVFLAIGHHDTVRTNVPAELDMSTGGRDVGTVTPAEPWEPGP
jgi:hypothetical protein